MENLLNRSNILTEKINPKSTLIDTFSTDNIIKLMNEEDGTVHQAINSKLVDRGSRIISELTGISYEEGYQALINADKHVKEAVVMVIELMQMLKKHLLLRFLLRILYGDRREMFPMLHKQNILWF